MQVVAPQPDQLAADRHRPLRVVLDPGAVAVGARLDPQHPGCGVDVLMAKPQRLANPDPRSRRAGQIGSGPADARTRPAPPAPRRASGSAAASWRPSTPPCAPAAGSTW